MAVAAALAASLAVALWAGLSRERHPSSTGAGTAARRTVLVADPARELPRTRSIVIRDCLGRPRTCANGAGGVVLAYAVSGLPPAAATEATVLSDESCQPDRLGVSHCLNALRLGDGRTLTVRHDHRMADSPCLRPGERVLVRPLPSSS